jgi:hypothetical protein
VVRDDGVRGGDRIDPFSDRKIGCFYAPALASSPKERNHIIDPKAMLHVS